mmetsp:Transcript_73778/g.130313  ORF Transcript_73778/g.130313 Transcript_73778/m.130313 type:complete len:230 (+) Transcript_73778:45-734(+)|eukprot:CAMPEP_0197654668 /NCGR_PEP_ID=MMETSP1338-20131121/38989_1 /TAXON_ID=43686 ORGANISM="Pelagodinium beii, Strain RCC1491" /NCGR_SAMPLE_ID=MMETSP1338 /ASSEMBLY_ACC=CAM_ASM_000754 /LENGTH=229 /DNA_ID=CAMNT_0043230159 /DNA_START=32 /DNA_END=721 /DNA_ORIENTATION=+
MSQTRKQRSRSLLLASIGVLLLATSPAFLPGRCAGRAGSRAAGVFPLLLSVPAQAAISDDPVMGELFSDENSKFDSEAEAKAYIEKYRSVNPDAIVEQPAKLIAPDMPVPTSGDLVGPLVRDAFDAAGKGDIGGFVVSIASAFSEWVNEPLINEDGDILWDKPVSVFFTFAFLANSYTLAYPLIEEELTVDVVEAKEKQELEDRIAKLKARKEDGDLTLPPRKEKPSGE